MGQVLTQRIKHIFPDHVQVIEDAEMEDSPEDGHAVAAVRLKGTRAQLDAFYEAWDVTDTGLHIVTTEKVETES
ncbi:hypothetical protein ACT3TS_17505 [Specibacter sp. AOP5-B1-6]|uniref:hypothetical protein n=1 Tax=Specibacter sp. AOP5-B1-6 TaxID=3457653 RepID=UPI00402B7038